MTTKTAGKAFLNNLDDNELNELIQRYPYFQNLYHTLLENNIELEGTDEFQNILYKTSLYSVDREFLYKKIKKLKADLAVEQLELKELSTEEDVVEKMELMDLEDLETQGNEILEEKKLVIQPQTESLRELPFNADIDTDIEEDSFELDSVRLMPEESDSTGLSMLEKIIANSSDNKGIDAFKPDKQRLEFLTAFSKTLDSKTVILDPKSKRKVGEKNTSKTTDLELEITNVPQSEGLKPKKINRPSSKQLSEETKGVNDESVSEFAEKSVMESEEVASETLAELLVAQEQYEKAINMYRRLQLLIPEKSGFFAEKINILSKL